MSDDENSNVIDIFSGNPISTKTEKTIQEIAIDSVEELKKCGSVSCFIMICEYYDEETNSTRIRQMRYDVDFIKTLGILEMVKDNILKMEMERN